MKKVKQSIFNMKYLGLFTLMVFLLYSCGICIEGEGVEAEETREMEAFSELEINVNADVVIHIGNQHKVDISAQENLLGVISTDVSGNKLKIDAKPCINNSYPVIIDITTTSLSSIKLNGSADITVMDELHGDDFYLKINGSGNVTADVFTNQLEIKINGSGDVFVSGTAKDADFDINGSGDIRAAMLQAYEADIEINGSGDAEIIALNDLRVTVKGSGEVRYSGDPSIKTSVSGSGSVTKID